MQTFPVFLVSFRSVYEPIPVREVVLSEYEVESAKRAGGQSILHRIFFYGQNDFQPKPQRSVSVGDVIVVGDEPFLVLNIGFQKLGDLDFRAYKMMDRDARFRKYGV